MFTVIFGRPGCPYCVRAKELAEKLTNERDDFNYRYVDIHAEGISKADLEKNRWQTG
ncbi:glutaredoxin 1 [Klebsiella pneumoniae]|uniref:Glutaredoxin 1 n=1 Tax=Klebsiella pneumoniae TaxID=573 RepID=A0A377TU55_KLEPN|nr:GrxA family glutaredoxin [Klebsiella pneumoniae]MDY1813721.1 GrxA family glutaredoxin [Klebsiella pneumoniae]STS81417.1 glutaredoxin 1 [Klebsiella pneumoniae]STV35701.1 glutaredoxin 1 [Klebsiella pneumoniae]STW70494.1 glutaredoxin 1 [Klebsiella pneumoniae]VEB06930.1 glutaredoxin 1 [Klebsiella pneumoniae]